MGRRTAPPRFGRHSSRPPSPDFGCEQRPAASPCGRQRAGVFTLAHHESARRNADHGRRHVPEIASRPWPAGGGAARRRQDYGEIPPMGAASSGAIGCSAAISPPSWAFQRRAGRVGREAWPTGAAGFGGSMAPLRAQVFKAATCGAFRCRCAGSSSRRRWLPRRDRI